MQSQDLEYLSKIGRTIWIDSDEWQRSMLETLTASSLLAVTPERALEKAAHVILERAKKADIANSTTLQTNALGNPFYRLSVEQRFILSSLHLAGWTYARLSRILNEDEFLVERLAWNARIQLSFPDSFPAAPGKLGTNCPEYEPNRPWTQRFLDEEILSSRERIFLQNHLMSCLACRKSLERCRKIYFKAENLIPRVEDSTLLTESIQSLLQQNPNRIKNLREEFVGSLGFFWKNRDIRIILLISLVWVVCQVFAKYRAI